ncbi:MAG: lysophospholipid acyltransferase family protein [Sphingomonas sp.]
MASRSIARADPAGWTRIALRVAGLVSGLAVAVPLHGAWRLCRLPSPWPRLYLGYVARVCGARVRRVGRPLRRNVVYLANHSSWLDIPAIAGATGSAFVAKAEVRQAPLVGWLCTLNRTIFVSRADRMNVAGQIADIADAIAADWAVTIFPEGTTGPGDQLLPFKGALLAALEPPPPGVMVQPVRVDYGPAIGDVAWVGDESGLDNALRLLARRGGFEVALHFLEPFDPADHAGRKGIAAHAHHRIATHRNG